jgi:hypothetical protein
MSLKALAEKLRAGRLAKAHQAAEADELARLADFASAAGQEPAPQAASFSRFSQFRLSQTEISDSAGVAGASAESACEIEVRRIEAWLRALDRLPEARTDLGWKLEQLTEEFWLGPWAHAALAAGWSDAELFALDGGLIPEMTRRTLHILQIDGGSAKLMTGRGVIEIWPRHALSSASPWWADDRWRHQQGKNTT